MPAVLLAAVACVTPRPAAPVPVFGATREATRLAERGCRYVGAAIFQEADALASAKDEGAAMKANAILAFGAPRGGADETTGRITSLLPRAQVIYLSCDEANLARLAERAPKVDDR